MEQTNWTSPIIEYARIFIEYFFLNANIKYQGGFKELFFRWQVAGIRIISSALLEMHFRLYSTFKGPRRCFETPPPPKKKVSANEPFLEQFCAQFSPSERGHKKTYSFLLPSGNSLREIIFCRRWGKLRNAWSDVNLLQMLRSRWNAPEM